MKHEQSSGFGAMDAAPVYGDDGIATKADTPLGFVGVLKGFEKIMCSLGGADVNELPKCPSDEWRRFFLAGFTNLLGSTCTAMALGVSLHAFGVGLGWLIPIVMFFGIIFFVLTMSLCGAIVSWGNERSGAKAGPSMTFRLIITVLLSLFTAMILETFIFADPLAIERREFEITEASRLDGLSPELREQETRIREEVSAWDERIEDWYEGINRQLEEDPIVLGQIQQRNAFEINLNNTSAQYQQWIRASTERIASAQRMRAAILGDIANLPEDSDQIQALNSQIQSINANIAWENSEQRRRNDRLRQMEGELASMNQGIAQRRLQVEALHGERRQELYAQRERARAALIEIENRNSNNSEINQGYSAMGGLIRDINLIRRMQARIFNSSATPEQRSTAFTIIFIGVIIATFFITIDLLPIITLFFFKSEHYNFLKKKQQEEREKQYTIEMQERIDAEELRVRKKAESDAVESAKHAILMQNEIAYEKAKADCELIPKIAGICLDSLHKLSSNLSESREKIFKTQFSNSGNANIITRLFDYIQKTLSDAFEFMLVQFDKRKDFGKTPPKTHDSSWSNAA